MFKKEKKKSEELIYRIRRVMAAAIASRAVDREATEADPCTSAPTKRRKKSCNNLVSCTL